MVKVNERFSFEKDTSGWTLYEFKNGVNPKTKEPTITKSFTYWSDLIQVCNEIIDRSCDQADDVTCIMDCINKARKDVLTALHGYEFKQGDFGERMTRVEIEAGSR